MLSEEEIETCKEELNGYIEFMETAGDNAGWARGLKWYIEQLETDKQKLIKKLEKDIEQYREEMNNTHIKLNQIHYMKRIEYAKEILKVLKGENDEQRR